MKTKLTQNEFLEKVLAFHGHAAPGVLIGGFMVNAAQAGLPDGCLFDAISETRQCLPDAIQILTPCTVGNGWLTVLDYGVYALCLYDKYNGNGFRAKLDADRLAAFPETHDWFLKLKEKKNQDSEKLKNEILTHGAEMITVDAIRMHDSALKHKSKGPITRCPRCGEAYPAIFGAMCPLCAKGRSYDII